ncbi:hypothetical protein BDA96_08G020900 [Sorghum bicolor]|uniref:Uncharacterized protein n=1 Tax=Sorghum bicolor TaxID=4558 RepID=A0A921QG98_SORBI|nr:hypothetical protein BDA96_08G020900 [Sorghum bicolor]
MRLPTSLQHPPMLPSTATPVAHPSSCDPSLHGGHSRRPAAAHPGPRAAPTWMPGPHPPRRRWSLPYQRRQPRLLPHGDGQRRQPRILP